jgi:SAM-dependent methyltransferase
MSIFKKITRKNLDPFLAKYASDKKVLDIGAGGSGYHKFFPNRLSVDIDPERKPDVVADAHKLPFADGEFEMVLCTEVLEHVKNPKVVMDEIFRVLKPGGLIVLTTRFVYPIHDAPHDYWRYTKYGLMHQFRNFKIIEIVPEAGSFSTIAILLQRLAFQSKFKMDKLVKLKLFVLAWIIKHFDWLVVEEYSDIKKSAMEKDIMTSGYYVAARKPE